MEKRGPRRRIIDSTSVPSNRRKDRHHSCDVGETDCSRTTSDEASNKCSDCRVTTEENPDGALCLDAIAGDGAGVPLQSGRLHDKYDHPNSTIIHCHDAGINKNTKVEVESCLVNKPLVIVSDSAVTSKFSLDKSVFLDKEQVDTGVNSACELKNSATVGNLDFTDEESILADLDNLLGTKQLEPQSAKMNVKPWMLPARHMIKESLFPAIPEEIHRELIDRNFMLPWNSIDQNETYKIRKHSRRNSAHAHKAKSDRRNPTDEAEITIERDWDIIPKNTRDSNHTDSNRKEIERRRDSFSLELIEKDEASHSSNYECSFQKTNVKYGLETKDPYSIELERTRMCEDQQTEAYQADLVEHIIGCVERTETESPLLDIIALDFGVNQDDLMVFEDESEG